jgi:hypothetical protein
LKVEVRKFPVSFLIAIIAVFFNASAVAQFYNGSQMEFGKNRVQFDEFLWSFYRFDKFDTYFYPGGKELAVYTAKTANEHIKELESIFDYELDGKIQFIVYNKQSHFRQSNLGLGTDDRFNIGGVTRIQGSKVFVYFEGDHGKLDAQIRAGIAEVLVNEMIYGNDWREIIKNSTLLVLPEWYLKGLVSFVSDPWNVRVENEVKDGIMSNRYDKFNRLSGEDAITAGHSMWHFIAENYGYNVISNIIYMTHVSRNIESGFLFVLGASLNTLTAEWLEYYKNKYAGIEDQRILPTANRLPIKTKKTRVYSEAKVSPDGRYVAFVSNELGQYRVHLYDREKNKMHKILKEGHRLQRINDYSYPLLAWHPSGQILSIILEKEAKPHMLFYSLDDKKTEQRPIFILDKVLDFSYSHDGRQMVFSAVINGQSDIYTYNIAANTQQQITNDIFDDLHPRFINNSTQIIFSSNRMDDTLRQKDIDPKKYSANKDIFVYTIGGKQNVLKRITNTPNINEVQPDAWEGKKITYLANSNRVYNRHIAAFDSVISRIDTIAHYRYFTRTSVATNYPRHILNHSTTMAANKVSEIVFFNGRHHLYVNEIGDIPGQDFQNFEEMPFPLNGKKITPKAKAPASSLIIPNMEPAQWPPKPVVKEITPILVDTTRKTKFQSIKVFEDAPQDTALIDINNYEFNENVKRQQQELKQQPPVPKVSRDTILLSIIRKDEPDEMVEQEFVLPNVKPYNVIYFTDQIVTQVDNNFTNLSYQPFMGGGGFFNPGMNALFKIGISDLFEDRKIVGGFRLSPSLNANEYFLSYENLTKRLDRQTIFHRRGMSFTEPPNFGKIHTHEIKHILRWPLSEVASIRGTVNLRQDRFVTLGTDFQRLQIPTFFDYWAGAKMEYVFDNVLPLGLNLWRGARIKVFGEYFRNLPLQQVDGQLPSETINMYILGADVRHYTKIHRGFIWANRFAASTSLGSHKLIYFMGGVDQWLLPDFNRNTRIDYSQNYIFQTLATPMRGFRQNSRNGNSFAVINSELRMPIFRYFINQPIKSDFINNFQIIGFGDIGTAWTGIHPYSDDNTLNTEIINSNPFIITLKNLREPIIGGYGFGLRSRLWGYFIRADWAWGVEDRVVQPRVFYLSLSLDF